MMLEQRERIERERSGKPAAPTRKPSTKPTPQDANDIRQFAAALDIEINE